MTEEDKSKFAKLSKTNQVFVGEYLACFNATAAYKKAHPKAKDTTAASNGWKLLRKTEIQEAIQEKLQEVHMSADEALKLTADIARGDIAQLMDVSSMGFNLDMRKAQELGLTGLIKKVKQKVTTHIAKSESDEDREVVELEVELYDKQAAIRDILKIHGKFIDRTDLTSGGETLNPYMNMSKEELLSVIKKVAKDEE